MNPRPGWILIALIVVYVIGFGIDIMDIDAAQYASMSREMLERGSYLQLYDVGREYLDKPPFLIWVSAISMKIFGANNFAYRLPSFLFSLLAIYSTYKLAKIFYAERVAVWSALILASCQAFFLMNHDVRTDTILMSWVVFSLWQLAAWTTTNHLRHLLLGSAGVAFGMMTKGPIALMVPIFAFGSHFLLQRNFKAIFKWQYILAVLVIGILLIPMCIGLYQQFDRHPEKIVNGQTGVSGLRFFFWTQSFGRITGESTWNNNSNIFFLLQNMLWSFLPWIIFFLIAFFGEIINIVRQRFRLLRGQEAITTGGFILSYLALGLSNYQLPHYIFVVFPLASIITAKYFVRQVYEKKHTRTPKVLLHIHFGIFTLLWMGLIFLLYYAFETIPLYVPVLASVFFAVYLLVFFFLRRRIPMLPFLCLYTIIGINLFLNVWFYPNLLQYQAGTVAGRWIYKQDIPKEKLFIHQYEDMRSLHFYARQIIPHKDSISDLKPGDVILTATDKLPTLIQSGISYSSLFSHSSYKVSRLSLKFLNPKTREKQLDNYVIIQIK